MAISCCYQFAIPYSLKIKNYNELIKLTLRHNWLINILIEWKWLQTQIGVKLFINSSDKILFLVNKSKLNVSDGSRQGIFKWIQRLHFINVLVKYIIFIITFKELSVGRRKYFLTWGLQLFFIRLVFFSMGIFYIVMHLVHSFLFEDVVYVRWEVLVFVLVMIILLILSL
jgi:hypothetical protein